MLVRAKFFSSVNEADPTSTNGGRLSLYVPESSIVDGSKVWVVSPSGLADFKAIEVTKDRRDDHLRVVSGLKSGERLILPPHNELVQGKRVQEFNTLK
jgi:multidrug efflux pump subunit AcrA (membrane-fusion protein)